MTAVLRTFLFAWQFLTAIPLSRSTHDAKPEELAASMSWYPLVGCSPWGTAGHSRSAPGAGLLSQVTNVLLILLLVAITRGLHQDGLADMVDGLAGGRTAQARLTIMRDGARRCDRSDRDCFSRSASRYAGLNALPVGEHIALLIGMPVVGRWAMVVGAFHVTYARSEGGLAQPFLAHLSWRHLCVATATTGLVLTLVVGTMAGVVLSPHRHGSCSPFHGLVSSHVRRRHG